MRWFVDAIDRAIQRLELAIMLLAFLGLAAVTGLQVVARQLDLPFTWTLEVAAYLLVWLIFTGASYGVRRWQHVRFAALHEQLPPTPRKALSAFLMLLVAVFAFFLLWSSLDLVLRQLAWGQMTATLPVNFSIGYTTMILPLSGLFMCWHLLARVSAGEWEEEREEA